MEDGAASDAPAQIDVHTPAARSGVLVFAALGGGLGAAAALVVLAAGAVLLDRAPLGGPNAVGAWAVRWLLSAAPDALDEFHVDATFGGAAVALLAGAVLGACYGALRDRVPGGSATTWGLLYGLVCWAAVRFAIAPALDPLLISAFGTRVLLPAALAYGLVLAWWVQAAGDAV